ncbi:MAG: DUF4250 domain-containing protein [Acetobacter sp.]|nr:DUF4250 domain-containing protein [Bacteroides sp.]MCM1340888.1 DUF4250 domain-containing protein [Acetobacter sp.]MCM1432555.1 DUF4250 domain-containing protein [Clostridiales bacterium]
MQLPKDPVMLMSVINMKLRDYYDNLDILCEEENIDKTSLCSELAEAGFKYNEKQNKFW